MILVIGGTGFLGRHFRNLLEAQGERFVTVTRNIQNAKKHSPLAEEFVSAEDFDGELARTLISSATSIVYLATTSGPSTFAQRSWLEISQVVAPISEFMLKFASVNPSAKRIFVSSGGTVYGNPSVWAVDEDQPIAPISAYGLGKQMVEQAIEFAGRAYGMHYNILRVSNPVGRYHQNSSQGVIPAAVRSLLTGSPFVMFGDGSSVRDYIDADDVAEAIWGACCDKRFCNRTWNIGSGVGRSVLEILSLVERAAHRTITIQRMPARKTDVAKIVLNCQRVGADLGWFPRRNIEETIAAIWQDECRRTDLEARLTEAGQVSSPIG